MKTQINVTVDMEVLMELQKLTINKSELINNFLRDYLDICDKTTEIKSKNLENEILLQKSRLTALENQKKEEIKLIKSGKLFVD
jgi:hypothetical protein